MEIKLFDKMSKDILRGLELAYEKMVIFKKSKGTPLVVSENGKVKLIDAKDILPTTIYKRQ